MLRGVDSQKDRRVGREFFPDGWQRRCLDVIDARESALVVAPTSSGKTFISFYVMSKNFAAPDNERGVVVFVCPTKALVNQVAADLSLRRKHIGVYGVFTREQRMRVRDADVLVTVPQCLEILLFSPPMEQWCKRIRYVIFDEVHSIGADDGAVWERLFVLVGAPFIALSATVRLPARLHLARARTGAPRSAPA
jgi:ATP-dependent RNA helicase DDX60